MIRTGPNLDRSHMLDHLHQAVQVLFGYEVLGLGAEQLHDNPENLAGEVVQVRVVAGQLVSGDEKLSRSFFELAACEA